MNESRHALLDIQTVDRIIGSQDFQMHHAVNAGVRDFSFSRAGGYIYLPNGAERRIVMFHATEEGPGDLTLQTEPERLALDWRKSADGAGFYGGNTPWAVSDSLMRGSRPRIVRAYLTPPFAENQIQRVHRGDHWTMARAWLSSKYGKNRAQQRTSEASAVEWMLPDLASIALRNTHVVVPEDAKHPEPRWIKLASLPEELGRQTLQYLGMPRHQPELKASRTHSWLGLMRQLYKAALTDATSRG